MGKLKCIVKVVSWIIFVLVLLVAIGLGVISQSKPLRLRIMKWGLKGMSKSGKEKPEYCEHFTKDLNGVVIDLGCGGGGLLNCWDVNTPIKKYIGVDPNYLAHSLVEEKISERNLTFEYSIFEDISEVDSEIADFVVTSLTLCSIDDLDYIGNHVKRVLNSGGSFVYFEHVKSRSFNFRRILQFILYPVVRILGDGCNLQKETKMHIDRIFGLSQGVLFEEVEGSYLIVDWMPYFARSVIKGVIRKI